jgi:hypothetical protein
LATTAERRQPVRKIRNIRFTGKAKSEILFARTEKKKLPQEVGRIAGSIYRAGRSRGITSNGEDKADSGKTAEDHRIGSMAIGQGD